MSAKLLQVVNSAAIGLPMKVASVVQAVRVLGLDTIKDSLLLSGLFAPVRKDKVPAEFDLEQVWSHSLLVARFARSIARGEGSTEQFAGDCFTSGLLHDVGQLVLATKLQKEFREALLLARDQAIPLSRAERRVLGITHAEVGGVLLELWELPHSIVETVTFHSTPGRIS